MSSETIQKVTASSKLCTKICFHAIVLSQTTGDNRVCQTGPVMNGKKWYGICKDSFQTQTVPEEPQQTWLIRQFGVFNMKTHPLYLLSAIHSITNPGRREDVFICEEGRDSWCLILMSICHVQTVFSCLSPNPQSNQPFDQDYQTEMHLTQMAVQTEIYVFYVSHSHQTNPHYPEDMWK